MVVLYSTGCPQCNVLKKKLDDAGVKYVLETDTTIIEKKGFMAAPVLEVDGEMMTFKPAIDWVKQRAEDGD